MAEVDGVEFEDDELYVVELEATVQASFTVSGKRLALLWPELEDGSAREAELLDLLSDRDFITHIGDVTREVRPLSESENPDTDA